MLDRTVHRCWLRDDFTGGLGISTGGSGETGWSIRSTADAGHLTDPIPGEANHPGICKISCAPITNSILSLCRGVDSTSVLYNPLNLDEIIQAKFVVRPLSSNNERLLVGFVKDPIGATANVLDGGTDGVYAVFDPAVSANWQLRSRSGSSNNTIDTGVAVVGSRWYEMHFTRSTLQPGSDWVLHIGALGAFSAPVTRPAPTGIVSPTVSVQSTTASARVIHLDLFELETRCLQRF